MAVDVEKDKKGGAYIISHLRCGYHECIWLSMGELMELYEKLNHMMRKE